MRRRQVLGRQQPRFLQGRDGQQHPLGRLAHGGPRAGHARPRGRAQRPGGRVVARGRVADGCQTGRGPDQAARAAGAPPEERRRGGPRVCGGYVQRIVCSVAFEEPASLRANAHGRPHGVHDQAGLAAVWWHALQRGQLQRRCALGFAARALARRYRVLARAGGLPPRRCCQDPCDRAGRWGAILKACSWRAITGSPTCLLRGYGGRPPS